MQGHGVLLIEHPGKGLSIQLHEFTLDQETKDNLLELFGLVLPLNFLSTQIDNTAADGVVPSTLEEGNVPSPGFFCS